MKPVDGCPWAVFLELPALSPPGGTAAYAAANCFIHALQHEPKVEPKHVCMYQGKARSAVQAQDRQSALSSKHTESAQEKVSHSSQTAGHYSDPWVIGASNTGLAQVVLQLEYSKLPPDLQGAEQRRGQSSCTVSPP